MNRRTIFTALAGAAALLPLSALGMTAPATAVPSVPSESADRTAVLANFADPGNDFTFAPNRAGVGFPTARRADVRNLWVGYGLVESTEAIVARVRVNKVTVNKQRPQIIGLSTRSGGVVRAVLHNTVTNQTWLTKDTKRIACEGVAGRHTAKVVVLTVPRVCLGSRDAEFRFRGTSKVQQLGKARVWDGTRWTEKKRLDPSALMEWLGRDPGRDVTFIGDPEDSSYAGESVDLTAFSYRADEHGVQVYARILDPSYYPWDVKQRLLVDWMGEDEEILGRLIVVPNRTEDGTVTVSGSGAWGSCASVATFEVVPDYGFKGRVPASCLSGAVAAFRLRAESLTANDEVTGRDSTSTSGPVLLS